MFRRAVLLLLFLLLLLPVVVHAEENGSEVIYAYFRDARWLRSEPAPGTPTVANVPERTMLRLEPLDDKYAYTTYKGAPGYIYYKDYVTVKYTDPHGPDAVTVEGFFGAPVYMRQSPLKNASLVALLPTDERFQITFVTDEYAYIVYEGQEGYVYIADFVQMEYARGSVEPYISYVDEETPAMATPYYGAVTGAILTPYTPITVDGYDGDHVTILYEGQRLYAMAEDLTRLSDDLPIDNFSAVIATKADIYGCPLEHAPVAGSFAKGSTVTVYGLHGQFVHVTDGTTSGYIFFKRLKDSKEVSAARKLMEQEQERLAQQRFLNIAFSMLEEGNPILEAHNAMGGDAVARFHYGCPYLWAGMHESSLLRARHPSSNSNYYFTDKLYLGGFDCIGYARWVHAQAGMKKLPAISDSRSAPRSSLINVSKLPYNEWQNAMKVGDCVNMHHKGGGYHIMIYIGTLRDFGFDESELGLLAPYVDNPLVIHCGMNNFHTAWYTQYLKESRMTSVTPPDGGVTVSILGVPYKNAPHTETMWNNTKNKKTFYWFDLNGYNLTVINPTDESVGWFCVYRNTEK